MNLKKKKKRELENHKKMPPKKGGGRKAGKGKAGPKGMSKPIAPGLVVSDLVKKEWKLGPVIGQGGFGYIYLGNFVYCFVVFHGIVVSVI